MTQLRQTNGFVESVRPWELCKNPEILNVVLHIILQDWIFSSWLQVYGLLDIRNVMFIDIFYML